MTTSSAEPERLIAFANRHRARTQRLALQAHVLAEADARFTFTCVPPPSMPVPALLGVVDEVHHVARRLGSLAHQTGMVGTAFAQVAGPRLPGTAISLTDVDLARLTRGIDPVAGLADELAALSIEDRRVVFGDLDGAQRAALVVHHAEVIGNLDGVPWRLRVAANARRVDEALDRARADQDAELVALLEGLCDAQVLVFDLPGERLAVVHGDLDAARNVAVFVPGMGSTVRGFLSGASGTDDKGRAIFEAAAGRGDGDTAVISWLGYSAPPGGAASVASVPFEHDAQAGAEALRTFVESFELSARRHVTLVGHSYGSLVVGLALDAGLRVDDVVLAGSPGVGADDASELEDHLYGEVYVLSAPGDAVAHLNWFGNAPHGVAFGATRLKTNAKGKPRVTEHANYFRPGSESLDNIAGVVAGGAVSEHTPDLVDRAEWLVTEATRVVQPELPLLHRVAERYDGPGETAVDVVDAIARQAEKGPARAVEVGAMGADQALDVGAAGVDKTLDAGRRLIDGLPG